MVYSVILAYRTSSSFQYIFLSDCFSRPIWSYLTCRPYGAPLVPLQEIFLCGGHKIEIFPAVVPLPERLRRSVWSLGNLIASLEDASFHQFIYINLSFQQYHICFCVLFLWLWSVLGVFFVLTTLLIIFIYNRSNNNNMATKRVIMSTSTWYGDLDARYIFEPVTIESLGVFTASARHLLSWKEDLWKLGRELPVPKDLDFGAALRCCPSAWQFAGYRLHRLMIVPDFVLSSQFLPARRYASAGNRDRNVSVRLSVCPHVCHAPVLCQNEES